MIKTYKDEIPPQSGRKYEIVTDGSGKSSITDVTEYEQAGSSFGAVDIQGITILEAVHTKTNTTHNLSIGNSNAENIKFKATASFYNGDSLKINNVSFEIYNTNDDAVLFQTNDVVLMTCDYSNNTVYIMNDTSCYICPPVNTISEIQTWLLTIPPGIHSVLFFSTQAALLTNYSTNYIGTFTYILSENNPRRHLEITSYNDNITKFEGSVDNSTGAVDMQRSDTNILTLSSTDTSNLEAFQAFIDSFNMGVQTFYCSGARSAAIGLPNTPHLITVQQSNDYGKWALVTAYPASGEYPVRTLGKFNNPATWESDWIINTPAGHPLTSAQTSDIISFILTNYPQTNIVGNFFIIGTYAAQAGLEGGIGYSVEFRRRGGSIIVIAIPWNDPSVEWRGNYTNSTWSGFTKYQLSPAPVS